jgi:hypothetical protein
MGSGLIINKCKNEETNSEFGVRLFRVTTLKGGNLVQIVQL